MPQTTVTCLVLVSLLALAHTAAAVPLAVVNPSFEDDVYADAGYSYSDPITGWTRSGSNVTVWNPAATYWTPANIPDGNQVLVIDPAGTYVTQVLSDTLTAGVTYTLTVGIGNRMNSGTYDGFDIQLRAGGTILAQAINTVSPAEDQFLDATVSFLAPAGHPELGQALEIRLLRAGTTNTTDFDLVRLDAYTPPPAPEPSSLLLLGLGACLLSMKRKRTSLPAAQQCI